MIGVKYMIDEKELIESLRASLNTGRETFPIDLIVERIKEQPKVGEWIPCSEALPPKPKENRAFDKKPAYLVSVNGEDYPYRATWNGRYFMDGFLILEAVAWMPLPEPYKGE